MAIEVGEDGLSTIVAALRLFQKTFKHRDVEDISSEFPEIFNAEHFQFGAVLEPAPLRTEDIDKLCERLNSLNGEGSFRILIELLNDDTGGGARPNMR